MKRSEEAFASLHSTAVVPAATVCSMKSPRVRFTPVEEQWRYGTRLLTAHHHVDDARIVDALVSSVFLNEQLHVPRKIEVSKQELPTEEVDPVAVDDIEITVRKAPKGSNVLAERILNTLLHAEFRRGSMKLIEPFFALFLHKIQAFIDAQEPIQMILPTLPSKGQNRARNDHAIDEVSLGEILFFAQMRDIVHSIKQIYDPGMKITVVTDGIIYADMFRHNDTGRAILYRNTCMELRDRMQLRDVVDIVDMDWLLFSEPTFGLMKSFVHDRLLCLWNTNADVKQRMESLMRGMIFNMPTPGEKFERALENINRPFTELPQGFQDKLKFTALRYASSLIALQRLQILYRAFPGALRATVHPKAAPQIGLHLVNSRSTVFPYHGVVLVSAQEWRKSKSLRKASSIVSLYDVYALKKPVKKYCEKGKESSLYFLIED